MVRCDVPVALQTLTAHLQVLKKQTNVLVMVVVEHILYSEDENTMSNIRLIIVLLKHHGNIL